jgi:predicted porin
MGGGLTGRLAGCRHGATNDQGLPTKAFIAVAAGGAFWCNRIQLPNRGLVRWHKTPDLFLTLEIPSMKKTLIALAAVAATSAAFAQSSVTLYGVADAALVKSSGVPVGLAGSSGMNNGNSRIGFRGVEDLGGGMKASFALEQNISLTDGSTGNGSTLATSTNTNTFQRAAWVALGGGFGEVSLGRRLNPAFNTAAAWELTGTANYSVVSGQFGAVLNGIRNNDLIMYTSPSFGGVTVQFGHVLKGDRTANESTNDISVRYAAGPLVVAADWNKNGESTTGANKHVGARYNFGAFTVAGAIIDPAGVAKGFSIGGSTMVGPVGLTLDIARDTEFKDTNVLIEGKYALSKRTFAYAAYVADGKGKTATSTKNLGLGVRHNF